MRRLKEILINAIPYLVVAGTALICALFFSIGTKTDDGTYTLDGKPAQISESTKDWMESAEEAYSKIVYASRPVPALLADGSTIDVPTIESIDSPAIEEDSEEGGRGSYVYAPTRTYKEFEDYTIGGCWNVDGVYGSQCWDLGALFWMNYTNDGRSLSTCGTGAAKGAWNCREQNAGDEFELVYSAANLKAGDWVIFGGGTWGHVGMALGGDNNGYVALFGQNQGGSSCAGGGSAANIINMSTATFLGAFRPKTYRPEPEPTPTPSTDVTYSYVPGDYFSGVLIKLGLDEGNLWGENGTVKRYTEQLIEQNMLDARGNVILYAPFTLTKK